MTCKKAVTSEHKSIQCQTCELWVHADCQGLTDEVLNILVDTERYGGICWHCDSCLASSARLEKSVIALEKRMKDVENVSEKHTGEIKRIDDNVELLRKELEEERNKRKEAEQHRDENIITKEEYREREARRCNVILHRVKEPAEEMRSAGERKDHDLEECRKIFCILNMEEEARTGIKVCRRIGEWGQEPRPLVVVLRTEEARRRLLEDARKLRNTEYQDVGIVPDLTVQQRREEQHMLEEVERRNEEDLTAEDRAKNLKWLVVGPRGARRMIKGVPREQHQLGRGAVRGGRGPWRGARGRGRGGVATGANLTVRGEFQPRIGETRPETLLLPPTEARTRLLSSKRKEREEMNGRDEEGEEEEEEMEAESRSPVRKK